MKECTPFRIALILAFGFAEIVAGGSLRDRTLQREFERLMNGFDGRVGACALDSRGVACLNGDQRFSLQSVMKLVVCLAVMDAVDRSGWKLTEQILIQRQDLSLYIQPVAELVGTPGFRTTVGHLVQRTIVDSDSAAADILIRKLGGPQRVQEFLDRTGVRGIRIDRDERHLQTEIVGLTWRPEYTHPAELGKAIASVPIRKRTEAYRRYQADVRDTSTPRAMVSLLKELVSGRLLSPSSTRYVLDVMKQTATFPDRLKAGLGPGWTLAHKTGTSGGWRGVTAATNDVGLLRAPDGGWISIAVFIGDSRASSRERAALMANMAATIAQYH